MFYKVLFTIGVSASLVFLYAIVFSPKELTLSKPYGSKKSCNLELEYTLKKKLKASTEVLLL